MALGTLPTELLMIVIASYPQLPLYVGGCIPGDEYLVRHRTIYALSQTCSRLRSVFLPLVWQSIEVFSCPPVRRVARYDEILPPSGTRWKKVLATELIRQLEIVTVRDPTLANYVQTVRITLTDYSAKGVFPEVCRALAAMPNLRTLHILDVVDVESESQALVREFNKMKPLLTVRDLAIPAKLAGIIPLMPNVQRLHFMPTSSPRNLVNVTKMLYHTQELRILGHSLNIERPDILSVVEHWPKLRNLRLDLPRREHGWQSRSYENVLMIQQNIINIAARLTELTHIRVYNAHIPWSSLNSGQQHFWADVEHLIQAPLQAFISKHYPILDPESEEALKSRWPLGRCIKVMYVYQTHRREEIAQVAIIQSVKKDSRPLPK